jgi:hypothetical protein
MVLRSSDDGGLFSNTAHDFKVQLDKQTLLNGRRFVALTEINLGYRHYGNQIEHSALLHQFIEQALWKSNRT